MEIKDYIQVAYQVLDAKVSSMTGRIPRGPLVVFFSLTERCNMRCKKCTIGKNAAGAAEPELSKDEIFAVLSQLASIGTKVIALWGGEPLLNKDLFEIVGEIRRLKMFSYLVTNGLLLNDKIAVQLINAGLGSLSVSIDEAVAEKHDDMRGIKGAFDRTCKGLSLLRKIGGGKINLGINMVISRDNIRDILPMAELAVTRNLNWLKFIPIHFGFPYNRMEFGDTELMPKEEEIDLIQSNLFEARRYLLKKELYTNSIKFLKGFKGFFNGDYQMKHCYAGYLLSNLDSYGNVNQCSLDSEFAGNIRQRTFPEIWKSKEFDLIRKDHNKGLCGHCWLSCFVEPSFRMSFFYSMKNIFQVFGETAFIR